VFIPTTLAVGFSRGMSWRPPESSWCCPASRMPVGCHAKAGRRGANFRLGGPPPTAECRTGGAAARDISAQSEAEAIRSTNSKALLREAGDRFALTRAVLVTARDGPMPRFAQVGLFRW